MDSDAPPEIGRIFDQKGRKYTFDEQVNGALVIDTYIRAGQTLRAAVMILVVPSGQVAPDHSELLARPHAPLQTQA